MDPAGQAIDADVGVLFFPASPSIWEIIRVLLARYSGLIVLALLLGVATWGFLDYRRYKANKTSVTGTTIKVGRKITGTHTPKNPDPPPVPAEGYAWFEPLTDDRFSQPPIALTEQITTIGSRDDAVSEYMEGEMIAGRHCRIERQASGVFLITPNSHDHATFLSIQGDETKLVRLAQVDHEYELPNGALVAFGSKENVYRFSARQVGGPKVSVKPVPKNDSGIEYSAAAEVKPEPVRPSETVEQAVLGRLIWVGGDEVLPEEYHIETPACSHRIRRRRE